MSDLMLDVDQASELKAAFRRAGWTNALIKKFCEGDNPGKTRQFLESNCRFVIKGPSALIVDRTTPFDPVKFIGAGWEIVEEDKNTLKLTTVDFSDVRFESGLKEGEQTIDGEEKLKRLKRLGIRLDAKCGQTLYEEKGQATLRWLYDTYRITWFELSGTVLRYSDGYRYFLYLRRGDDGSWGWAYLWLDNDRSRDLVSPLLASNT